MSQRHGGLVMAVFAGHVVLRFAGLWHASLIPLSMMVAWPMPWLLSDRAGRAEVGFRLPALRWIPLAGALGLVSVATCALTAWLMFGTGTDNWFARHTVALAETATRFPAGTTVSQTFWYLTIPAMIFSPIGEEILFRGYPMQHWARTRGPRAGLLRQAGAFSVVHLAHYGLHPFQPALIPLWLLSMFGVAVMLGWLAQRSRSLIPAKLAHVVFNLLLNVVSFTVFY
jgi:membrane protease YdiL (CAAX protease family)